MPPEWFRAGVPKPGWAGEHVISRRTTRRTTNPRQYSPLRWPRILIIPYQYDRRRQRPNIAVGRAKTTSSYIEATQEQEKRHSTSASCCLSAPPLLLPCPLLSISASALFDCCHGSFACTFYSERISKIIEKLSQKYHVYLVIT